jgi:hypothetical protein
MENSSGETPISSAHGDHYTQPSINEHDRDLSSCASVEQLKDTIEEQLTSKSQEEKNILERELNTPTVNVSYRMLFRYSSKTDLLIFTISTICAMASGAVMPIMTVCIESFIEFKH